MSTNGIQRQMLYNQRQMLYNQRQMVSKNEGAQVPEGETNGK
jgi:hypothetical protein